MHAAGGGRESNAWRRDYERCLEKEERGGGRRGVEVFYFSRFHVTSSSSSITGHLSSLARSLHACFKHAHLLPAREN
jgi:hypothetical protein